MSSLHNSTSSRHTPHDDPHKTQKPITKKKKKTGPLPNPPYNPDESFMENQVILLPMMKDGVIALGDLYNCKTLLPMGNLFEKPLLRHHLEAHPIETMDYTMHRIRDYSDYSRTLKVSASLTVEMPLGGDSLKVSGSGAYEKSENSKAEEESIQLKYDVTTYRVRLLPSCMEHVTDLMLDNISGVNGEERE